MIQKLQMLQLLKLLRALVTAFLRERFAETSENSSNSSISLVAFESDKPFSNPSIGGGGGRMVPFDAVVAVEKVGFCNIYSIQRDVKMRRARQTDLPPANPYRTPDLYFKGYENRMGYILEEHFVTLWRGWR